MLVRAEYREDHGSFLLQVFQSTASESTKSHRAMSASNGDGIYPPYIRCCWASAASQQAGLGFCDPSSGIASHGWWSQTPSSDLVAKHYGEENLRGP